METMGQTEKTGKMGKMQIQHAFYDTTLLTRSQKRLPHWNTDRDKVLLYMTVISQISLQGLTVMSMPGKLTQGHGNIRLISVLIAI